LQQTNVGLGCFLASRLSEKGFKLTSNQNLHFTSQLQYKLNNQEKGDAKDLRKLHNEIILNRILFFSRSNPARLNQQEGELLDEP
jgi:hypothetical protein